MKFAKIIGERYLWVDSLCIVQNGANKAEEIGRMDMIYGQSILTTVAMSGTAAGEPLPGINQQRCAPLCREYASDLEFVSQSAPLLSCIATSQYRTRGWTFQEELLSKRHIYFTHQEVFFECAKFQCREINFQEDYLLRSQPFQNPIVDLHESVETLRLGQQSFPLSNFLTVYEHLVISYSKRNLTKASDAIHAITGIFRTIEKLISDARFISGLPSRGFDLALLWRVRPIYLVPRDEDYTEGRRQLFPSWSWASCPGPVDFMIRYRNMVHTFSNMREDSFRRE
jgi:hypothetical protein